MKKNIGISIYPENQNYEDMKKYIEEAAELGYSRIFASLLEVTDGNKGEIKEKFKKIFSFARSKNFSVCVDVNPMVFDTLGITPDNLSFFKEICATTIRLDTALNGSDESIMTHNKFDLEIEINLSNGIEAIDNVLLYKPNLNKLIGCHNFYPQKYSGLDYQYFLDVTKKAKSRGIRTAAFVSGKNAKIGPWNVNDGLPTLEIHRNMDSWTAAKHLWTTGLIDDVLFGNAIVSKEELSKLSKINRNVIELEIEFLNKTSKIEKEIILNFDHFRRGDINSYSIRSTMSRVVYKKEQFPEHDNSSEQQKGEILIGNNKFGVYKGELQLILQKMPNDSRKNLVAKVSEKEIFLIEFIEPWKRFKFVEGEK